MAARKKAERVTLVAPNGTRVTVSAGSVERHEAKGYKRPERKQARRPAKTETKSAAPPAPKK